ncbi:ParB N-terminal domain-containing protein [Aminobacter carboxidus]|uniref:ParB N-terminal domain-containing protein n=1 Tax=Aminobacter carboxidus TaxID=376165 RepID=UPI001FE54002|nr:ParB N-terminal domain-containing protein [Aminobacter lissarensis]
MSSIKAIGLVEAPVVILDSQNPDKYLLVDGHLRLEALKKLGASHVECLLATDDDTWSFFRRNRGCPRSAVAIRLSRLRLLVGISPEAAEMLDRGAGIRRKIAS